MDSFLGLLSSKNGLKLLTGFYVTFMLFFYVSLFFLSSSQFQAITSIMIILPLFIFISIIVTILIFSIDPFKGDRKSRSYRLFPEVRFFLNEVPSLYLVERCEKCSEDGCENRLEEEDPKYVRIWFREFFNHFDYPLQKQTLQRGFWCRFIFYAKYSSLLFALIGTITLGIQTWFFERYVTRLSDVRMLYIIVLVIVWFGFSATNRPNEKKPTGVWASVREINRLHVDWLKSNEAELKEVICPARTGL